MKLNLIPLVLGTAVVLVACGGGGGGADQVIPPFWSQRGVVVADFDGDGRNDVAVATTYIAAPPPHPGYVEVWLQTLPGRFALPVRYPIGPDPWGMSLADVDSDGHPDLVIATPMSAAPLINTISNDGGVSVLRQDAARPGQFLPHQWLATGGVIEDVASGDLDGDGRTDLVAADGVGVNQRALLLHQSLVNLGLYVLPPEVLTTGGGAEDVTTADVNGDGRLDVVLAADNGVVLLYQRAVGGFDAPVVLVAGLRPSGVAVVDLDGDGRADITVANAGNAPAGGVGGASVTVLRQTSPGVFTSAQLAVPDGARRVAIGDLDIDGRPDLAVVSIVTQTLFVPSSVTVLLQVHGSPGQFVPTATYTGTANASFIAIDDLNGDGFNDLLLNDGPGVLFQRAGAPGTFDAVRVLP